MRYLSVCSGIEAATVAWHPLGWTPAAFSEIEAFPRAVLAHHYPDTPCHGDFTTIGADEYGPIDLLVGGTPCQSFSIAGLRGGLADDRGNLALEYLRLADRKRPRWLVWENVPGVLSSSEGRDFGAFLGALGELGYGFAYRVLDAQFFGVAQRRRRVFVVGYAGDWRRAAAVLFERHSLQGHPAPRREKGQAAPTIPSRSTAGGGLGTDFDCDGGLVANTGEVAACLVGHPGRTDWETETFVTHSLSAEGFDASEDGTGRGTPPVPVIFTGGASDCLSLENCSRPVTGRNGDAGMVAFSIMPMNSGKDYVARETDVAQPIMAGGPVGGNQGGDYIAFTAKDHGADAMDDCSPTLRAGGHSGSHANAGVMPAVAFRVHGEHSTAMTGNGKANVADPVETARTLDTCGGYAANQGGNIALQRSAVRRLTPRECERLQGFPDDYTAVPYRGKPAADGPRYKALGNSMAVPVMAHIGHRIQMVEDLCSTLAKAAA